MCRRNWTKEEIEYLEDKWGTFGYLALSKKLNRSVASIKNKAHKLNLGNQLNATDLFTFNSISVAFSGNKNNISYAWDLEKWTKAGLEVKNKKILNKTCRVVDIQTFWKFAKENIKLFNFALLEKGALGVEPEWVEEIRELQKLNPTRVKRNKKWSVAELNKLKFMVRAQRYTYTDISIEIGRTECAVRRMLTTLKIKERPLSRDGVRWTNEEKQKMIELRKKGIDANIIAKQLGKTEFSIYYKLSELGL